MISRQCPSRIDSIQLHRVDLKIKRRLNMLWQPTYLLLRNFRLPDLTMLFQAFLLNSTATYCTCQKMTFEAAGSYKLRA
jgi:hypothetical protein